ncbi:MAG: CvpA family protein [Lachnospiraceae bacterium]|nr:CvpA family protein [Lachnospiraceae bacterium]
MSILEIIIIVITIALVFSGVRRGFVKKLASMLSLVLSIVLVSAVLPYVTGFLKNNTPLYDYIFAQCEQVISDQTESLWTGLTGSLSDIIGTDLTGSLSDLTDTDLTGSLSVIAGTGLTGNISGGTGVSLSDGTGTGEWNAGGFSLVSEETGSVLDVLMSSTTVQNEIINALPIPQMLKNMLIANNNEEGYESLNVSGFQDYIVGSIATLILNAVSFLVAVLLVNVALRVALMLLDVFSHFPVIGLANRLAGAAFGLVEALFLLWFFFIILTIAQTTETGAALMTMVNNSALLSWLYEANLFLRIMLWGAAIFS